MGPTPEQTAIHPARRLPYEALLAGLEVACARGHVRRRVDPTTGLALYIYTARCVYEDGWTTSR